jgi:hypothetical protein
MRTTPAPVAQSREDAWTAHLRDVLRALDIPAGAVADNLTAGIALYCRQFHPRGLQSSDLRLLIARAFCAIDERAAAGRVLASMEPHRRHITRWLEILLELHHFPDLLPYFSRGIIRPAEWAGARSDRMWMIDFSRFRLLEKEKHEMTLFRSVRLLIDRTAVFWEPTDGEGILGLKGLSKLTLETHPSALSGPENMRAYIEDLLGRQQALRNWRAAPSLLMLDL